MHADDAVVVERLSQADLAQRWREIVADPQTPEFVELSEFGELILTPPPTNKHELVAFEMAAMLKAQLGPRACVAISVSTKARGVRRPDAIWMKADQWQDVDPLPFVPEICVEVLSPSNTPALISMKTQAYLDSGAKEVITVGLRGEMRFFGIDGERAASAYGLHFEEVVELFRD